MKGSGKISAIFECVIVTKGEGVEKRMKRELMNTFFAQKREFGEEKQIYIEVDIPLCVASFDSGNAFFHKGKVK